MLNTPAASIYFRIAVIAYVDMTLTANAPLFAIQLQEGVAY
jgi:hypothetical protein